MAMTFGIHIGCPALTAFGLPFERIGVREDMKVSEFAGKHFQLNDARNNPKPLRRRLPIWIGGLGETRTLQAAAKYADGWNAPYIGPEQWRQKNAILDDWCAKVGRDPGGIRRTVNVGFYMGADARGAARGEKIYQSHFGKDPRTGFVRGTARDAVELIARYRDAGVHRVNIAFRQGPYDWDALHAYAEEVVAKG
ncbi:MAG: LLM class flavin-dependent oxidoreductase [Candidatus Rokubacteria bacterium]|nr:LLM class flavin-dependent oxidoreductase [Candidatus Rokubacteria bacterium]